MRTYIIAEAACEHLGSMDRAINLIRLAKTAGADCVKFQMFDPETASDGNEFLEDRLRQCYLTPKQFVTLRDVAATLEIEFLLSVFCDDGLFVAKHRIGANAIKIPSGRSHNLAMVTTATRLFDLVYCSFGMMTSCEIQVLLNQLSPRDKASLIPMFCVSSYPTVGSDVTLGELAGASFYRGYSAHTRDPDVILAATAIGHTRPNFTLEFHIALDREGPDDAVSYHETEACELVKRVWRQDLMFSTDRSEPLECEKSILWRRK